MHGRALFHHLGDDTRTLRVLAICVNQNLHVGFLVENNKLHASKKQEGLRLHLRLRHLFIILPQPLVQLVPADGEHVSVALVLPRPAGATTKEVNKLPFKTSHLYMCKLNPK